jgi:hypothetical protein
MPGLIHRFRRYLIGDRLEVMRRIARERGDELVPPALAMGTSERVGSNWFSDTLRAAVWQHNEPFRQQLHPSHPLSPLNPDLVGLEDFAARAAHPFGQHWLITFVTSKYGPGRQLIKETNLFFAVGNFLRLFHDAPVIILSRNPIGIASSFVRADLFRRWNYHRRYTQLQAMVARPPLTNYRFAVHGPGATDLHKLVRLIVLNTLLLAEALHDRPFMQVAYESAVADQRPALLAVSRLLVGDDSLAQPNAPHDSARFGLGVEDATFTTRQPKTRLRASLSGADVEAVRAEMGAVLGRADGELAGSTVRRARQLLDLDGPAYVAVGRPTRRPRRPARRGLSASTTPRFVQSTPGGVWWRVTLVTNSEFGCFLNDLCAVGVANVVAGTHLLVNESMPHARGGRIRYDLASRSYCVSPGYELHPVYWITWIGAAVFARYSASRLPTRGEMDDLVAQSGVDLDGVNADYRIGDVAPVVVEGLDPDAVHHPVGNLQVWCADGPPVAELVGGPMTRFLHGVAWNTPAAPQELRRVKARHLTGTSRGVGVRLVRDQQRGGPAVSAATLAKSIHQGFLSLTQRERPLSELEDAFVKALT